MKCSNVRSGKNCSRVIKKRRSDVGSGRGEGMGNKLTVVKGEEGGGRLEVGRKDCKWGTRQNVVCKGILLRGGIPSKSKKVRHKFAKTEGERGPSQKRRRGIGQKQ